MSRLEREGMGLHLHKDLKEKVFHSCLEGWLSGRDKELVVEVELT